MTETLVLLDNTALSNFSVVQQPSLALEARLVSLDQANALLSAMIVAGYRSPVESLDALLRVDR